MCVCFFFIYFLFFFKEKDVHSMGHCPVHPLNINYSSSQDAADLWFM